MVCPNYHGRSIIRTTRSWTIPPGEYMRLELRIRVLERLQAEPGAKQTASEMARGIMSTCPDECAQKIADSSVIKTFKQLYA